MPRRAVGCFTAWPTIGLHLAQERRPRSIVHLGADQNPGDQRGGLKFEFRTFGFGRVGREARPYKFPTPTTPTLFPSDLSLSSVLTRP
jgi:hypothetical protein